MKTADFLKKYNTVTAEDIQSLLTDESKPLIETAEKAVRKQIAAALTDQMSELGDALGVPVVREQTDTELAKQVSEHLKAIKSLEGSVATAESAKAAAEKELAASKEKMAKLEGDNKDQKRRADVRKAIEEATEDSDYAEQILKVATEGDDAPITRPDFDKAKAEAFVAAKIAEYDAIAEARSGNRFEEVDTGSDDDDSPFVEQQRRPTKTKKQETEFAL
jgi:hypothetical protein